ncbi:MAG: pilus assembly protein, partial [Maricaulaceae bacterium]
MFSSVNKSSAQAGRSRRALLADDRGTAAIEFALIAPILMLLYFAVVELSLALDANRKVSMTASVIGDLVAQADEVSVSEVEAILDAADATMQPLNVGEMELRITSLTMDGSGDTEVAWSRSRNADPHA